MSADAIRAPRINAYVRNIVFASPGVDYDDYLKNGRSLASFYGALLGMRMIREDWIKIAKDEDSTPQIAFGDGPGTYEPPRWGDPEHPQQVHLDIAVADLQTAEDLVVARGATVLQDMDRFRTYADPVGHPFCLYAEASGDTDAPGRIQRIVFDCFSPRALAAFYADLMDMHEVVRDAPERVEIKSDGEDALIFAFQHSQFVPPRWPDPAFPQQVHLDIYADDATAAEEHAMRLGAMPMPAMGGSCPVFADPSAHPFCLCGPSQ